MKSSNKTNSLRRTNRYLVIFGKTAGIVEPSQRTLNNPSLDAMEQLSLLFNEAEVYGDQAAKENDNRVVVAAHKRRKKHEYTLDELPENVPVEVVEHRLTEEELVYQECGNTMTEIGKDVRRHLHTSHLSALRSSMDRKRHRLMRNLCLKCEPG